MTRAQRIILSVLIPIAGVLFVYVIFIGARAYDVWKAPLNAPLETPPTRLVSTLMPYQTPTLIPTGTLAPTLSFGSDPLSGEPICGGPKVMNLLMIGIDARSGQYKYGLADAIRLVRIDFTIPRVSILEFPRDLWVEIPEIQDNINQDHEKLNQAYLYGNPGFNYYDHPSRGPGLLARTLNLNFGVHIDHYIAVSMKTFIDVVDAIGGIDVNLPDGVDGRTSRDSSRRLIFPKGEQHLDGEQALTLSRIRNVTVFVRAQHQDLVMCAIRKKLLSPDVVPQIPQIITAFQNNVQTDLSPEQISQLACVGSQLSSANITFANFPEDLFTPSNVYDPVFKSYVFIWNVKFNTLRDYVTKFQMGYWPVSPLTSPIPSQAEEITICQ